GRGAERGGRIELAAGRGLTLRGALVDQRGEAAFDRVELLLLLVLAPLRLLALPGFFLFLCLGELSRLLFLLFLLFLGELFCLLALERLRDLVDLRLDLLGLGLRLLGLRLLGLGFGLGLRLLGLRLRRLRLGRRGRRRLGGGRDLRLVRHLEGRVLDRLVI